MYQDAKKSDSATDEKIVFGCFLENNKGYFWIVLIMVAATAVYAILTCSASTQIHSFSACRTFLYSGRFQNTAFSAYSDIPVKQTLIKELAMEVGASQGKGSVIIQSVYVGGNAEKAGLQAGDRIARFNGRNIRDVRHFQSIVSRAAPESEVKIRVIRDNHQLATLVMIGEGEMEGVTIPVK